MRITRFSPDGTEKGISLPLRYRYGLPLAVSAWVGGEPAGPTRRPEGRATRQTEKDRGAGTRVAFYQPGFGYRDATPTRSWHPAAQVAMASRQRTDRANPHRPPGIVPRREGHEPAAEEAKVADAASPRHAHAVAVHPTGAVVARSLNHQRSRASAGFDGVDASTGRGRTRRGFTGPHLAHIEENNHVFTTGGDAQRRNLCLGQRRTPTLLQPIDTCGHPRRSERLNRKSMTPSSNASTACSLCAVASTKSGGFARDRTEPGQAGLVALPGPEAHVDEGRLD
jgi:hypothetical protein